MMTNRGEPFFIGYVNHVPRPLALFLVIVASAVVGAMAGLALAIGAGIDDPGDGHFAFADGRQNLVGTLRANPYPVLHIPADGDRPARAVLLAGQGKRGVIEDAVLLDGRPVEASGVMLKRGGIDMLQVGGAGLRAAAPAAPRPPAPPESMGRWRLTGEICDGKCWLGAMRPGNGLAHKACANLCIIGGLPPVFVSSGEVSAETFFLLADKEGGPLGEEVYDLVALMIEVEGEVERRDDLMLFKIDLDSVRVL
jgi:hypothetical protein